MALEKNIDVVKELREFKQSMEYFAGHGDESIRETHDVHKEALKKIQGILAIVFGKPVKVTYNVIDGGSRITIDISRYNNFYSGPNKS